MPARPIRYISPCSPACFLACGPAAALLPCLGLTVTPPALPLRTCRRRWLAFLWTSRAVLHLGSVLRQLPPARFVSVSGFLDYAAAFLPARIPYACFNRFGFHLYACRCLPPLLLLPVHEPCCWIAGLNCAACAAAQRATSSVPAPFAPLGLHLIKHRLRFVGTPDLTPAAPF